MTDTTQVTDKQIDELSHKYFGTFLPAGMLEAYRYFARAILTLSPAPAAPAPEQSEDGDYSAAVLRHLDELQDEAAAHIYPDDLERCAKSECTATVYSVRVGCPSGRSVPLFSRQQVVDAIRAARKAQGGE